MSQSRDTILKECLNIVAKVYSGLRESKNEGLLGDLPRLLTVYMGYRENDQISDQRIRDLATQISEQIPAVEKNIASVVIPGLSPLRAALPLLKTTIAADALAITTERAAATVPSMSGLEEDDALLVSHAGKFAKKSTPKKPGFTTPSFSKGGLGIVFAAIGVAIAILAGPAGWVAGLAVGLGILGFAGGWSCGHAVDRYTSSSKRSLLGGGGSGGGGEYSPRNPHAHPELRRGPDFVADSDRAASRRPESSQRSGNAPTSTPASSHQSDEVRHGGQSARRKGRS